MCIRPPLFHRVPLMSFTVSRAFSLVFLFLSAPLGSAIFLCTYSPFVCCVCCINPTSNTSSCLSLGSASFGLRKRSPHLCSSGGLPMRRVTFGVHRCLPARLCSTVFCVAAVWLTALNRFLHSTDPVLQNSADLQKNHMDGVERWELFFNVTPKTQNSSRFGRYFVLYSKKNP